MSANENPPAKFPLGQRPVSLGWLTESGVIPKKQKAIEGVGASSAIELKAQLYKTQEERRLVEEGGGDVDRKNKRGSDFFSQKNSGVEERANRDKLQLKRVESGAEAYEALERKSKIYEKLMRGELPDEEDKEKYSVDFLKKGYLEEEKEEMEREKQGLPPAATDDRTGAAADQPGQFDRHKVLIREVHEETEEARQHAEMLKQKRKRLDERQREKLKQAFLQKRRQKMLLAKKEKLNVEEPVASQQ